MTRYSFRKILVLALVIVGVVVVYTRYPRKGDKLRWLEKNNPLRARTLQAWKDTKIEGDSAIDFLLERSTLLWDNATELGLQSVDPELDAGELFAKGSDGHKTNEIGAAVAIHPDGYYLTAAHCVASGRVLLMHSRVIGPPIEVLGTVIWNGETSIGRGCDLAIVYAPTQPDFSPECMAWSAIDLPSAGTPVLVGGSGGAGLRVAGGAVLKEGHRRVEFAKLDSENRHAEEGTLTFPPLLRMTLIFIDIPIIPGDSGGPVMMSDGTLLGVAVGGLVENEPRSILLRPDVEWLEQTIKIHRDWLANNGQPSAEQEISTVGWLMLQKEQKELDALLK